MKPYYANIEITDKCNYDCIHCFNSHKPEADMALPNFKLIMDRLESAKIFYYNLTGGEPLLHEEWEEIVAYLDYRSVCYSLNTNGSLLNENRLQYLKRSRVNSVKLSLDGPKDVHNGIRRNTQAYDSLVNCTSLLGWYQIPFSVQVTLMDKNREYVAETCKIAEELGASAIRINFYKDFKNADKSVISLRGKELRDSVSQIETIIKENRGKARIYFEDSLALSFRNRSPCGAGLSKIQVDANCNLFPCRYLPIKMGNLLESELAEILAHPIMAELDEYPKKTKAGCYDCSAKQTCRGGCPAYVYNAYGTIWKRDPRCWMD